MGYKGQTMGIPFNQGGANFSKDLSSLEPTVMTSVTNVQITKAGRHIRQTTFNISNATYDNENMMINSMFYWVKSPGNRILLSQCGRYLSYVTNEGWTPKILSQSLVGQYTNPLSYALGYTSNSSDGEQIAGWEPAVFMTSPDDKPFLWTGVGGFGIIDPPSDWSGAGLYPKQFVMHSVGNSINAWAFGCNNSRVYVSGPGSPENFSDDVCTTFVINTSDSIGVVGGFEFGNRLFAVSSDQVYIIEDTDVDRDSWGYQAAQWKGGTPYPKLIVKTSNDVIMMAADGEIFSVTAANTYGDYKAASLTVASEMNKWIRDNVPLYNLKYAHAVYDPVLRCIRFFVPHYGSQGNLMMFPNHCLVYYIDKEPKDAWTIFNNRTGAHANDATVSSGYFCGASTLIPYRNQPVFTGGYRGIIYTLDSLSSTEPDGNTPYFSFDTPQINCGMPNVQKLFDSVEVTLLSRNNTIINVDVTVDGKNKKRVYLKIKPYGEVLKKSADLGGFKLNRDKLSGDGLFMMISGSIGMIGKTIQFEFSSETMSPDIILSEMFLNFKPMGVMK